MKLFLTIVEAFFVAAKLTGAVTWSWWAVLAPLWVYLAFTVLLLALYGVLTYIGEHRG